MPITVSSPSGQGKLSMRTKAIQRDTATTSFTDQPTSCFARTRKLRPGRRPRERELRPPSHGRRWIAPENQYSRDDRLWLPGLAEPLSGQGLRTSEASAAGTRSPDGREARPAVETWSPPPQCPPPGTTSCLRPPKEENELTLRRIQWILCAWPAPVWQCHWSICIYPE